MREDEILKALVGRTIKSAEMDDGNKLRLQFEGPHSPVGIVVEEAGCGCCCPGVQILPELK